MTGLTLGHSASPWVPFLCSSHGGQVSIRDGPARSNHRARLSPCPAKAARGKSPGWTGTVGQPPVRRSGRAGWPRPGGLRTRCVLQKWQCVEDASGKLKLHKCKGPARPGGRAVSNLVPKYYAQGGEACVCDSGDEQLSLSGRRKKLFKKSTQDGRGGTAPGQP